MNALLTRQEAAEKLGISLKTLDGMISRGSLRASRIGPKLVRINEADLEAYVSERLVAPVMKKAAEPAPRPCRYYPGMKVV